MGVGTAVEVGTPVEGDTLEEDNLEEDMQVVVEGDILAEGGTPAVEGSLDHKGVELQKSTKIDNTVNILLACIVPIHHIKCNSYFTDYLP